MRISKQEQLNIFIKFIQSTDYEGGIDTQTKPCCSFITYTDNTVEIKYNLDKPIGEAERVQDNLSSMVEVGYNKTLLLLMLLLHEYAHYKQYKKHGWEWIERQSSAKAFISGARQYRQLYIEKSADRYARRYYKQVITKYSEYIL